MSMTARARGCFASTSSLLAPPSASAATMTQSQITPIFIGDGEGGSGFAATATGGVFGFEFGVDPNLDPELALALRVSMEEETARQEAIIKKAVEDAAKQEKGGEQQASSQDATMTERARAATSEAENKINDLTDDEHNTIVVVALFPSQDCPRAPNDDWWN